MAGDDTHGHVDDLSRFVDAHTVVTIVEDDRNDANYAALQENLAILKSSKGQDGKPLRVATLPMPAPVYFDGFRLPASYAKLLHRQPVGDRAHLHRPQRSRRPQHPSRLVPQPRIVGIPCRDLVLGLGTLHCMTQQQPVGAR